MKMDTSKRNAPARSSIGGWSPGLGRLKAGLAQRPRNLEGQARRPVGQVESLLPFRQPLNLAKLFSPRDAVRERMLEIIGEFRMPIHTQYGATNLAALMGGLQ